MEDLTRTVRFTVQGCLETSIPEEYNAKLVSEIEDRIRYWLQTAEIKGNPQISFYVRKEATVAIVNPLAAEIRKNCADIINKLVLALHTVGIEAQIGLVEDDEFGELPVILTIGGHKSDHRYCGYFASVGFSNYKQCYHLSLTGYKINGDVTTLQAYSGNFDFQRIAAKMKDYYSKKFLPNSDS